MSAATLAQNLHDARYVCFDEATDCVYAWFGGERLFIYCALTGVEIRYITDGTIETRNDAIRSIKE